MIAHSRVAERAGFIPNSMVSPTGKPEEGMAVSALFVEVDELRNRMILSQRQLLQASLLKTLTPGSVVEVCDGLCGVQPLQQTLVLL
jgi:ribosomal protein S1